MKIVAVIGSGMAAVGACKGLIKRGIQPIVIDVGATMPGESQDLKHSLQSCLPENWSPKDFDRLKHNPTVATANSQSLPTKFNLGSDYFYGTDRKDSKISSQGSAPPFSFALGGLAEGWGSAFLPPHEDDLNNWPVPKTELHFCFESVLKGTKLAQTNDRLCEHFPIFGDCNKDIERTLQTKSLLANLENSFSGKHRDFTFGASRLMVNSESHETTGCKYCGCCVSGCVYDSIYKPGREILKLHREGLIKYMGGCFVTSIEETKDKVKVHLSRDSGHSTFDEFDRVFIAAGAVNSTRIILNSLQKYNKKVKLKTVSSFVTPLLRLSSEKLAWPRANTLPHIFFEFKNRQLSNHWIHTQISTPNELVLQKFLLSKTDNRYISFFRKTLASHLLLAHGNLHSKHSSYYELELRTTPKLKNTILHTELRVPENLQQSIKLANRTLFKLLIQAKTLALLPATNTSLHSGSYHVGGTMPMSLKTNNELSSDIFGRVGKLRRTHVVDSSIFPCLPATTIGILASANAYRICLKCDIDY